MRPAVNAWQTGLRLRRALLRNFGGAVRLRRRLGGAALAAAGCAATHRAGCAATCAATCTAFRDLLRRQVERLVQMQFAVPLALGGLVITARIIMHGAAVVAIGG